MSKANPQGGKMEMIQKMQRSAGKLRVFVRSRKVPVGLTEFTRPVMNGLWILSQSSARAVVYESVLDESQAKLLEEARRLSDSSGLDLEVVDLGKMGLFRRLFWSRLIGPLGVSAGMMVMQASSLRVPMT